LKAQKGNDLKQVHDPYLVVPPPTPHVESAAGGGGRHYSRQEVLDGIGQKGIAYRDLLIRANPLMPKSRGRKPKKKRAPASAPKKRLDNFNTTPQEPPLLTQPPQEPLLATAPRQEQPTKIKQIAKLTTAVVLAAIAIVLCAYAFILTKQ
jgi:hypothetical protein